MGQKAKANNMTFLEMFVNLFLAIPDQRSHPELVSGSLMFCCPFDFD